MPRYLVESEAVAAAAMIALVRLARRSTLEFTITAADTNTIVQAGLEVVGAEEEVSKTLGRIPGVVAEHSVHPRS